MNLSYWYKKILNIYGTASSLLPQGRALPPVHAVIELTYLCNLRCKMCYQDSIRSIRGKFLKNELTTGEIKSIVDWMLPSTLITLTGGEVFTKKDSQEIIEYICKSHRCNIITNAALINKDIAETIVNSGVMLLGISIDGIGKTHDDIRKVDGTFKKAIESIKLIQKLKKHNKKIFPLIDIKMVILKENAGEIQEIYKLAKSLRADYLTISVAKPDNTIVVPPIKKSIAKSKYFVFPEVADDIDYKELESQIEKLPIGSDKSPIVRFYPNNINEVISKYYKNEMRQSDYLECTYPWTSITISPYGDIFPCYQLYMGNIRQNTLSDIWNGQKYRDFRTNLKKSGIFPACHGCCSAQVATK